MRVPVRLWAAIRDMVGGAAPPPTTAAAAAMVQEQPPGRGVTGPAVAAAATLQAAQLLPADKMAAVWQSGRLTAGAATQQSSTMDELPDDIMQRRMPRNVVGHGVGWHVPRVCVRRTPQHPQPYSLHERELPAPLLAELEALREFACGVFYGQRVEPLRPVSFKAYRQQLL